MLVAKLAFCFSASPQGWDSEMLVSPFLVARRSREDENGGCEGDGFCFPTLAAEAAKPTRLPQKGWRTGLFEGPRRRVRYNRYSDSRTPELAFCPPN